MSAIQRGDPVLYAVIDDASSGDNTVIAAVSGKKIRVHSLFLVTAGAVNVTFETSTGGPALTGAMNFAANGGIVLPHNPTGWFETDSGELLNFILSGATSVAGGLTYTLV